MGSIVLGLVAGVACFWSVTTLKRALGYDDSLDVFGVHGVGGIIGALGTAIVASPALGGAGVYDYVTNAVGDYDMSTQFISQAWGVGVALVWSGTVSLIGYKIVDVLIGLRVSEEVERQGLDTTEHGETAYHV
jgi:Amt family ammonium transporter